MTSLFDTLPFVLLLFDGGQKYRKVEKKCGMANLAKTNKNENKKRHSQKRDDEILTKTEKTNKNEKDRQHQSTASTGGTKAVEINQSKKNGQSDEGLTSTEEVGSAVEGGYHNERGEEERD